jgi:hypothetical protein
VKDALERYPNIDVTTTSEVHGQLVAMGLARIFHAAALYRSKERFLVLK